jgi:ATP-dependent Zn protease
MIEIALSGMIAVRVMTGTMTSGNKSDIEKAISIATDMLDEGFYGIEHLSFVVNKDDFSGSRFSSDLTNKRGNKIVEILTMAIANVEKVMQENKGLLEKLAVQLVEKRELSNKEFIEIIENEIKIGSFNSCNVYKSIQKSK